MAIFIGVDSGTQSTKAIALDIESGRVLAEARAPHRMIEGLPVGHLEQDPAEWVLALDSVLEDLAGRVDRTRVRGIGVSGQQHGFVPLDGDGRVIRPAKLWCDTSTEAECALLTRRLGGRSAVLRLTGLPFLPGYTAPKILWLKRHEPENFRRLRQVLLPHDYLNFHLTGAYSMEAGDASGTALMDVRRRRWCPRVLEAIDRHLGEWLPPISASDRIAGLLRPELAQRYRLPAEVIVSAGGGDNMMGAIGTGNVVPGVVTASIGTSGTIYACAAKPVVDPRGEIAAFCSSTGRWLPLLCTMNATTVTERVRGLFGFDHAAMERAARQAPPGAAGLVLVPYLAGERTPNVPAGSGVLLGLDARTFSAPYLARAAMEGVALGMNYGLRRLAALGVRAREIRLTGGGAKSPLWRQIMADVFGVPVVAMAQEEGAALGAALQAAWALGRRNGAKAGIRDLTAAVVAPEESTRRQPDPARSALYRELQALQDRLAEAAGPLFARQRRLAGAPPLQ